MSEITPLQSEDPLPPRVNNPDFSPKKDYTLGEYVVTNPRDPFVWLASATEKVVQRPSKNAKQVLWAMYRMSGNFPDDDEYLKWRDRSLDTESLFKDLYEADLMCIDRYQKFLAKTDAEEAFEKSVVSRETLQLTSFSPFEFGDKPLHEPSPAALVAAAAILEHAYIISQREKSAEDTIRPL